MPHSSCARLRGVCVTCVEVIALASCLLAGCLQACDWLVYQMAGAPQGSVDMQGSFELVRRGSGSNANTLPFLTATANAPTIPSGLLVTSSPAVSSPPAAVHGLDTTNTPSPKPLHRSLAASSMRMDYAAISNKPFGLKPRRTPTVPRTLAPLSHTNESAASSSPLSGKDEDTEDVEALRQEVAELRAQLLWERSARKQLEQRLKELEVVDATVKETNGQASGNATSSTTSAIASEIPILDPAPPHPVVVPLPPESSPPPSAKGSFRKRRLSKDFFETPEVGQREDGPADGTAAAAFILAPSPSAASLAARIEAQPEAPSTPAPAPEAAPSQVQQTVQAPPEQHQEITFFRSQELGEEAPAAKTLALTGFHSYSCHGCEPAEGGSGRSAKINQDCAGIAFPVAGRQDSALFSIFDGHGDHGHTVSTKALNAMHAALDANGGALLSSPPTALAQAFEDVQSLLTHAATRSPDSPDFVDAHDSGACALIAYLRDASLWVANVGDCRAVLGTKREGVLSAVALSTDHKPDIPTEAARIKETGGYVRPASGEGDDFSPARLFEDMNAPWLGPGLAISRSMGDLNAERCGLISVPEVISHQIDPTVDKCLILASDGVWEFITPAAAVEIVNTCFEQNMTPVDACKLLIAHAAVQWKQHEGDYRDDITATVLWLPEVVQQLQAGKGPQS